MTKIAIITDTHFSARNGSEMFHALFDKFYTRTFFPALREHGITEVLHLGDLFDRRKYIDFYSLKRCKEYFFEPLAAAGIQMHVLVGNHDIALRNSLEINSPTLLLAQYSNISTIAAPTELSRPGAKFLMVPWICSENYTQCMEAISTSDADILCGHLEINGFSMYRGVESHEGFAPDLFGKFDTVFSGHYHYKSASGNVQYLGNPYELTHMDAGDQRGFHILDTETRELTFIENPYTMFERYVYDDSKGSAALTDVTQFAEKFVKVVVQQKTDFYAFDLFMDRLYNCGAHDVKVMETVADMSADQMDSEVDIENTQSILAHYISSADVTVDRDTLTKFVHSLYTEALHVET